MKVSHIYLLLLKNIWPKECIKFCFWSLFQRFKVLPICIFCYLNSVIECNVCVWDNTIKFVLNVHSICHWFILGLPRITKNGNQKRSKVGVLKLQWWDNLLTWEHKCLLGNFSNNVPNRLYELHLSPCALTLFSSILPQTPWDLLVPQCCVIRYKFYFSNKSTNQMQQPLMFITWRLLVCTTQHVSGVFTPIIRSSTTATAAASGFTVGARW